jgi:type II secretory pathway pseudopilin PulG
MKNAKNPSGFLLVELVVTLILVGIIGIFTGLFLFTGLRGYMTSKETSEGALLAQTALERISKELRDIEKMDTSNYPPATDTSVTYWRKNSPERRRISFSDTTGIISISLDGGTEWPLIKNVKDFDLTWTEDDLNNDGTNDIKTITIGFNTEQVGQMFSTTIYPRGFYDVPPPP